MCPLPPCREARRVNSETVAYTYDARTSLEYSLTYAGFKEDIVVSQYTGQTEYQFTLYTNGLTLTQLGGSYYLTDAEGEIRASIGEVIVFTADEKNNTMGQMLATTVEENQIYNMTILLDADYLADPNTTYPIRIDPTVNLTYAEAGADALEDVVIQSNNTPLPQYTASVIGKSSKGISRLLVRFPGIDFYAMEGVTVTSAYLSIRDLLCEAESMTLTCYPFTGSEWTETTANWSMTQSWGAALDSKNISYNDGRQQTESHRYNFDISALVQQWVDGTVNDDLGIILRADDTVEQSSENFYKTFGSYERSSNKTYFVMEYNENISLSREDVDIYVGDSLTLHASTFPSGQNVTWSSENPEIATVEHGTVTGISPGTTTITARIDEDSVATCEVTVLPKSVTLNPTSVSIYVGHTISLTADTVPEETLVEWISYNTSVATVSNGVVTGISPGTTTIIARVNIHTVAQCEVTVLARGIFIDPYKLSLYTGETAIITSTTVPAGEDVVWYSTNESVVTVSDGVVTAVGPGTATIGAYVDLGAETICDVIVYNWIELDNDSVGVNEGETITLMAITNPSGQNVTWTSSAPAIAMVDDGVVTGVSVGTANITAMLEDGTTTECIVYVLESGNYYYKIIHYYDQGYAVRFSDAADKILEYQEVCSDILRNVFSIEAIIELRSYLSCADVCKGTVSNENLDAECTHTSEHLTTSRLRNDIISQYGAGTATTTRVVWSGHILDNNPSSNSSSGSHTVVITTRHTTNSTTYTNKSDEVVRYESIFTLLHETSHQLGAPDHYCYGDHTNGPTNPCSNPTRDCWRCDNGLTSAPACVMSYRVYTLEEDANNGDYEDIYCSQCTGTGEKSIRAHLTDHH